MEYGVLKSKSPDEISPNIKNRIDFILILNLTPDLSDIGTSYMGVCLEGIVCAWTHFDCRLRARQKTRQQQSVNQKRKLVIKRPDRCAGNG